VYTEASAVLRAVAVDFFFNCWCSEIIQITIFGMYQGASTVMLKTCDWKFSRVSMFEVEAIPQSYIP
jgi:hypothetical protein